MVIYECEWVAASDEQGMDVRGVGNFDERGVVIFDDRGVKL